MIYNGSGSTCGGHCLIKDCKRRPHYGVQGGAAQYCKVHKQNGLMDLIHGVPLEVMERIWSFCDCNILINFFKTYVKCKLSWLIRYGSILTVSRSLDQKGWGFFWRTKESGQEVVHSSIRILPNRQHSSEKLTTWVCCLEGDVNLVLKLEICRSGGLSGLVGVSIARTLCMCGQSSRKRIVCRWRSRDN